MRLGLLVAGAVCRSSLPASAQLAVQSLIASARLGACTRDVTVDVTSFTAAMTSGNPSGAAHALAALVAQQSGIPTRATTRPEPNRRRTARSPDAVARVRFEREQTISTCPSMGSTYWRNRANGDGAESMLIDELPDVLRGAGLPVARWAVAGWSMDGHGALLMAERHDWFRAVAASSSAIWFHAQDTRPGAFDNAQDCARRDVLASLAKLPAHVRIDCGGDDPFASTSAAMLKGIPNVEGRIGAGPT